MNILAIDTTTKKANVGLKLEKECTISSIDNEITHSEKLLPLIDDVLKQNNLKIKDIACLCCTTGPGSFTGIRIGLATIKAIAKVTGAKIFSMDSLSLLYHSSDAHTKLNVCLIDAKNTRAYVGIFDENGEQITEFKNKYISDILIDIQNICNENNIPLNEVTYILDNASLVPLIQNSNYVVTVLNLEQLMNIANNATMFEDYLTLDATYVRQSEAERTKYGE